MSRSASPIDLPDDRIVIDRLLEKLQIVHRRIYRMEAAITIAEDFPLCYD